MFKIGQRVRMTSKHPWSGQIGKIIGFHKIRAGNFGVKPQVEFEGGHKAFIMRSEQAVVVRNG